MNINIYSYCIKRDFKKFETIDAEQIIDLSKSVDYIWKTLFILLEVSKKVKVKGLKSPRQIKEEKQFIQMRSRK